MKRGTYPEKETFRAKICEDIDNVLADIMTIKEAMGHKSLSSTSVYLTLGIGNGRRVTSPYDV